MRKGNKTMLIKLKVNQEKIDELVKKADQQRIELIKTFMEIEKSLRPELVIDDEKE
jgi:hypothetical protein